MKLADQLVALQKQREDKVTQMVTVNKTAQDEGRSFVEAEKAAFDDCSKTIEEIDGQIARIQQLEKAMASSAQPVVQQANGTVYPTVGNVVRNIEKGTAFVRYVKALAMSQGNVMQAAEIAKQWAGSTPEVETILRAAVAAGTTTGTTWAAPLAVYTDTANEFIELLRPETIMGRLQGMRRVPFNVRMPRQTGGATVGWVGEGTPKPVSALAFDNMTIPHTKIAGIVAITEELARLSSPSAEATIRNDLIETIAQFTDVSMFNPALAGSAGVSPASLTNGAPTIASSGSTVAAVTADLNAAITSMAVANIGNRSRYWLMNPRTANFLMTLRTSQDVFAFRDELIQGRLMGYPIVQSNNIALYDADGAGTGTALASTIVLIETSEIFLADDGQVSIDVSREATLQMDSAPSTGATTGVSLWQNNMIGIRAERWIYWTPRRPAAVFTITGVLY